LIQLFNSSHPVVNHALNVFLLLGLPKGVVNIVYGKGDVLGRALAGHPNVHGVALVSNSSDFVTL
jgi:acyl-CoA reductase-like NAD-dependent aldehyde dehydrogenase